MYLSMEISLCFSEFSQRQSYLADEERWAEDMKKALVV